VQASGERICQARGEIEHDFPETGSAGKIARRDSSEVKDEALLTL
jgi:hypothetical protein